MPKLHKCHDGHLIVKRSCGEFDGNRRPGDCFTFQVSDRAERLLRTHGISEQGGDIPWDLYYQLREEELLASMRELREMYFTDPGGTASDYPLDEMALYVWKRRGSFIGTDPRQVNQMCIALQWMAEVPVANNQFRKDVEELRAQAQRYRRS